MRPSPARSSAAWDRASARQKALELGLKVDVNAIPAEVAEALNKGEVDLTDPASTLVLLKANAVVGVTGFFAEDGRR